MIYQFAHSSQQVTVYAYNPNRTESLLIARAIDFRRLRVTYTQYSTCMFIQFAYAYRLGNCLQNVEMTVYTLQAARRSPMKRNKESEKLVQEKKKKTVREEHNV